MRHIVRYIGSNVSEELAASHFHPPTLSTQWESLSRKVTVSTTAAGVRAE
jgi:hypothetical protein